MSNKGFTNYLILRLLSPFIIFFIFTAVVSFFDSISSNWSNNSSQIIEANNEEVISKFGQEKEFLKSVFWNTNYDQSHGGVYRIQSSDYYSSLRNRSSISIYSDWNAMAKKVINNDYDKLNSVYTMLQRIRTNNNYDKYEFADAIVSFVQDIPYSLIDNTIDIYAPVEFLKKYKGDCDTRTILLYVMLKNYNYDVIILNSNFYEHSILGINLATSGSNYKILNGKRYYAWETTNTGWTRGLIPSRINNMYLWNVGYK
ncbi:transglutaminase-like domain-containing protein [Flavobacteriaceae bacterium]|nr:transglutaminase-like domain-containing protein [Flavobacteriaceae bacterium]